MILKITVCIIKPSFRYPCLSNTPSFTPPVFSTAFCERIFRWAVLDSARLNWSGSKIYCSNSSLVSLFYTFPHMECVYQQYPIVADLSFSLISYNRIMPIIASSFICLITKLIDLPLLVYQVPYQNSHHTICHSYCRSTTFCWTPGYGHPVQADGQFHDDRATAIQDIRICPFIEIFLYSSF